MGIIKRRLETLEGSGTVRVGDQSYQTVYRIQVTQEFHETRTSGELPGVVDLEGHFTLIGVNTPTDLPGGEAILTLEDGRRVGIVCSSLHSLERSFPFQLGNSMDFTI